jgi:MFS family permease
VVLTMEARSHIASFMNTAVAASRAVFAAFLIHGIMLGAWVTQIPLAKARLDTGLGAFGVALLSFAAGAVVAMPIAGYLINRFGSAAVLLVCGIGFALSLFLPSFAPNIFLFVIGGALLGAMVGSMDVAMNAHGLAVEKALKRPVLSGYHGAFSLGAAIGTIAGAWLLDRVGAPLQISLISGFSILALVFAARYFLDAGVDRGLSGTHFAWPTKATIGLGLLCFLALMIEGSVADWGALMLQERFAAAAATAALAFGFYQTGMAASRFGGDYLRARYGAVNMVVVSAVLTAVATAAALYLPGLWTSLAAFAIAGIGVGNLAPVLFAGGGRLEPDAPGRGIAAVTSLGYSGFLAGPPLIGIVAEAITLQHALMITVVAALIIAVFAKGVAPADTY